MGTGLRWLQDQTARYGVQSEFIWDYTQADSAHPLSYQVSFKSDLTNGNSNDGYCEVRDFVKNNINIGELTDYYNAEDFIIVVHLNAPNSENYRSYAHEILHCFGAADLYYANDFVPQAYVDYLDNQGYHDLMNSCFFSELDRVTCDFSELDAWFVGLTNTCEAAKYFNLGPTIFQRYGSY